MDAIVFILQWLGRGKFVSECSLNWLPAVGTLRDTYTAYCLHPRGSARCMGENGLDVWVGMDVFNEWNI